MASSAAAAPSIERIVSLDSGDLWARFSDSTSVCLHASGATFSTCGGVPEGRLHHDPSSSPAAPSSSPSPYSSSAALDRRCQVTRFCTHSWREKLRALLRFRNLVGTRTAAAAEASADAEAEADAIDVRPIVDADDLLPPDAEADAGAADFTVRFDSKTLIASLFGSCLGLRLPFAHCDLVPCMRLV
jgi:hypothetical protein